jgi:hypothetical protein
MVCATNKNPISIITRAKRAGGVAQVVPSKHKALSSNPNTAPPERYLCFKVNLIEMDKYRLLICILGQ